MSKKLIWFQPTAHQLEALQKEQRRRGKSMDGVVKQAIAKMLHEDHSPQEFSAREFLEWKKVHPDWKPDSGGKSKRILLYKGKFWKAIFAISGMLCTLWYLTDYNHDGLPDALEWIFRALK